MHMRVGGRTLLVSCLAAASLTIGRADAGENEEWSLRKQNEALGIDVYERDTAEGHREFLGVTRVRSRLSALVALLRDVEHMPEWVHRIGEVRVIEPISPTENVTYTVYDMPWPFRDRDAVLRVTLEQDPADDSLRLHARAHAGHPLFDDYIRIGAVESTWHFTPLPNGEVEVRFRAYADPGGQLSWGLMNIIQNKLIWQAPLKTLERLHEVIDAPQYQSASYGFVREPERGAAGSAGATASD